MLSRLALVLMLILLPLQWGLAQAHDSADEIQAVALRSLAGQLDAADITDSGAAHSQEPGGVCEFHELAHTVGLAAADDGALASPLVASAMLRSRTVSRLAAGPPADIERPKWRHHGLCVVSLPASV